MGTNYRRSADFRTTLETEDRMRALKLYELDNVEGQSISPFVWRIKFALRHKGIAYESVPVDSLAFATSAVDWLSRGR